MPSVRYTARARKDVDREWRYLVRESGVSIADRFFEALEETSLMISTFPMSGMVCDFISAKAATVRKFSMKPPFHQWLIFYIPTPQGILVYRIVHGARDLVGQVS